MKSRKTAIFALAILLFLAVFFVRSLFAILYGSSIGYDDQWFTTVPQTLVPYLEGTPWVGEFFNPASWWGHPWYTPRLIELGLTVWNGAWDSQVTMLFNALWYSAVIAVFFFRWVRDSPEADVIVFVCAAALFANPLLLENATWAYQGGFYEQIATALLAIQLAGREHLSRLAALFILVLCSLGLLGSGSGVLLLPTVVLLLIRSRYESSDHRRNAWVLIALLILLAGAYFLWFQPHATKDPNHVQSLASFLRSLTRCVAWPFSNIFAANGFAQHPGWVLGLPVWIPSCIIMFRECRRLLAARRNAQDPSQDPYANQALILLGLVVWQALNVAAFVYARGGSGFGPAARHADIMMMNIVVNLLVARHLWWTTPSQNRSVRAALQVISLYVFGLAAVGGYWSLSDLGSERLRGQSREISLHDFLIDGDENHLRRLPPRAAVSNDVFLRLDDVFGALRHEKFRAVLPACVQPQPQNLEESDADRFVRFFGRSATKLELGSAKEFEAGPFERSGWLQLDVFNPGTVGKISLTVSEKEGSSKYDRSITQLGATRVVVPRRGNGPCRVRIENTSDRADLALAPESLSVRGPFHMGWGSWLVHQMHLIVGPGTLLSLFSLIVGTIIVSRCKDRNQPQPIAG